MFRLFKFVAVLAVLGFVALAGFAYLGDLSPDRQERRVPVALDAQ